jgi:AraC-like DNA-binding protein
LDVTESDQAYERIVLWLSPRYLKSLSTATTDLTLSFQITSESGNHLIRDNGVSSSLHTSLQSLLNLQERAGYGEDIEAQQLVQKVLLELGRYVQGNQEALKKPEVNSLVSEAITYIDAHLEEPLSLEELANKLYIGKYYLLHLFKKQTNTTPHQYILKKRLLLSKRYIEQGEPIREVYLKAGFSDYTHYFRAFKQEYGMTPKEYYYLATR